MKRNYINQIIDEIKLIVFNCFLFLADNSITTIKDRNYFIEWSDKIAEESCLQSIEIHSIDKSKEINCVISHTVNVFKNFFQFVCIG